MRFVTKSVAKAIAVIALLSVFTVPVMAQELKVGVVNVPVLMERAPQAAVAMDALQNEFATRQREIIAKQKEYGELGEKVQRDVAFMNETERRNVETELRNLQREVTRLQNEFREDLNLRRNEELGKLQSALLMEVQSYAKSAGFDLVLGDGVLYASTAVNITDEVLKSMEAKFQASDK